MLASAGATIVGTPAQVREGIEAVASEYGAARGDRRHDHVRPRGPAPLLRADRRRVRAPAGAPAATAAGRAARARALDRPSAHDAAHCAALPLPEARLRPPSMTPATAEIPSAPFSAPRSSPIHVPGAATLIPSAAERETTLSLDHVPAPAVTPMPQPEQVSHAADGAVDGVARDRVGRRRRSARRRRRRSRG